MSLSDDHLGDTELEKIFQRDILSVELEPFASDPVDDPRLLMFAGQPGTSSVTETLRLDPEWNRDMVKVGDLTTFRRYHPRYHGLIQSEERGAGMVLETAAWWLQQRALRWALDTGCNAYVAVAPDRPDQMAQAAEQFADAGAQTRLIVAAVPAARSQLAVLEQHATARSYGSRQHKLPDHDTAYQAIPGLLEHAEATPQLHRITVVAADGVVHDKHCETDGQWWPRNSSVDVAHTARDPAYSPLQRAALLTRLTTVTEHLDKLGPIADHVLDMISRTQQDLVARGAAAHAAVATQDIAAGLAELDIRDIDRPGYEPPPPRSPGSGPEPT